MRDKTKLAFWRMNDIKKSLPKYIIWREIYIYVEIPLSGIYYSATTSKGISTETSL